MAKRNYFVKVKVFKALGAQGKSRREHILLPEALFSSFKLGCSNKSTRFKKKKKQLDTPFDSPISKLFDRKVSIDHGLKMV